MPKSPFRFPVNSLPQIVFTSASKIGTRRTLRPIGENHRSSKIPFTRTVINSSRKTRRINDTRQFHAQSRSQSPRYLCPVEGNLEGDCHMLHKVWSSPHPCTPPYHPGNFRQPWTVASAWHIDDSYRGGFFWQIPLSNISS